MDHQEIKDISACLKHAAEVNIAWKVSEVWAFAETLSVNYTIDHWREEENWITVLSSEKIVGYVFVNYPIVFSDELLLSTLTKDFGNIELIEISTDQFFFTKELSLHIFGIELDVPITAEQLWFLTN